MTNQIQPNSFWQRNKKLIIWTIIILSLALIAFLIWKFFIEKKSDSSTTSDSTTGDPSSSTTGDPSSSTTRDPSSSTTGDPSGSTTDQPKGKICKAGTECKNSNGSVSICNTGEHCVNGKCKLCPNNCANLNNVDTCQDTIRSMNNNSALYGCCLDKCKNSGGSGCCLWAGCVSCGFDTLGKPNLQNIYLAFLNDPENMAKFMVASASYSGNLAAWKKAPGTFPMFSNEVSHDWLVDPTKTGIESITALDKSIGKQFCSSYLSIKQI